MEKMIRNAKKLKEIKEYYYGDGYFPKLYLEGTKIVDARCRCAWSQNNPNAFKSGNTLCWHIICALREYYLEVRNGKIERIKKSKSYRL